MDRRNLDTLKLPPLEPFRNRLPFDFKVGDVIEVGAMPNLYRDASGNLDQQGLAGGRFRITKIGAASIQVEPVAEP